MYIIRAMLDLTMKAMRGSLRDSLETEQMICHSLALSIRSLTFYSAVSKGSWMHGHNFGVQQLLSITVTLEDGPQGKTR